MKKTSPWSEHLPAPSKAELLAQLAELILLEELSVAYVLHEEAEAITAFFERLEEETPWEKIHEFQRSVVRILDTLGEQQKHLTRSVELSMKILALDDPL